MKALLLALAVFSIISLAQAGNIWNSVPGNDNPTKIANIQKGVLLARRWVESEICTHQAFFPDPAADDNVTVTNWAAFFCSYWGGPVGTTDSCTYYYGGARSSNTSAVLSGFTTTYAYVHSTVLGLNTSVAQYNVVRDAISYAVAAVGASSTFAAIAIADFDVDMKGNLTNNPNASNACPVAANTIQWAEPITVSPITVQAGDYVTWVWADAAQHSVQSTTAGFVFKGMGAETYTLTKTTNCTASTTAGCVVVSPPGFSFSHQFTGAPGASVSFDCAIHGASMAGSVMVQGNPSNSPTSGIPSDGIGTSFSSSTNGSSITESGAVALESWFSLVNIKF